MAKRPPRRFGIPQAKRRLKSLKLELAAIGGAYDLSSGELRYRILALLATVHELIERFPLPPSEGSTLRSQALDELLASIREYAAASPAFRPYWRRLARHDIARFKRDFLRPERAAFEAAVSRQQARRIAA